MRKAQKNLLFLVIILQIKHIFLRNLSSLFKSWNIFNCNLFSFTIKLFKKVLTRKINKKIFMNSASIKIISHAHGNSLYMQTTSYKNIKSCHNIKTPNSGIS